MRIILLLLMLILSDRAYSQATFDLPPKLNVLPVSYLKDFRVDDTNRKLSTQESHSICRLFIKAYLVTKRKYKQDYPLLTSSPVYKLFKANYPDISKNEGEHGAIIFMEDIYEYIDSLPQHKTDIAQVMREEHRRRTRLP